MQEILPKKKTKCIQGKTIALEEVASLWSIDTKISAHLSGEVLTFSVRALIIWVTHDLLFGLLPAFFFLNL